MLATCGRVDTYAVGADGDRAEAALLGRLARRAGVTPEALTPYVQALRGAVAARHVMRTAAGLESPVLGEPEILGQLRRAHDRARRAGATGPIRDRLVRDALRAGRRARPSWAATCSASTRTPAKSVHHRPCPAPCLGRGQGLGPL
jgi:glutamyl-tRNA reductase